MPIDPIDQYIDFQNQHTCKKKECYVCKKEFKFSYANRLTCSGKCRMQLSRARAAARKRLEQEQTPETQTPEPTTQE